jgi:hypothetical protein
MKRIRNVGLKKSRNKKNGNKKTNEDKNNTLI